MSTLNIKFDLRNQIILFDYSPADYWWCDIYCGFVLHDGVAHLGGGHLSVSWHDGTLSWPPTGQKAISTDQKFVIVGTSFAKPGSMFSVDASFENSDLSVHDSFTVEREIYPAPFPSWSWNGDMWIPPTPRPEPEAPEGLWQWNEEILSWEKQSLDI